MNLKLIHDIFKESATRYGSHTALFDEYSGYSVTYRQLYKDILSVSAAMKTAGIQQGMHVAQFSENSSKWLVLDQAVLNCGAINAVRGSLAPIDELKYIYTHSDSAALITDNLNVVEGLYDLLVSNKAAAIFYIGNDNSSKYENSDIPFYTFDKLLEMGEGKSFEPVSVDPETVSTLIYSSGTTGRPKGVMLTHRNITSQVEAINPILMIKETKTLLTMLPIWHAYERTCEYYLFSIGSKLCYTNIKNFKKDLTKYHPYYMIAVPRLYEAIYDGIMNEIKRKSPLFQKVFNFFVKTSVKKDLSERIVKGRSITNQHPKFVEKIVHSTISMSLSPVHCLGKLLIYNKLKGLFGKNYVRAICGGGALCEEIDNFYSAVGIELLIGYGLTETSPVLSVRLPGNNKVSAAGPPLPNTEFIIADPETLDPLPKGQKGIVLVRGPQIMKGYYKDKENTKKVILPNGCLNTGDIGWLTDDGYIVLTGRAKDIIVLSNGENIEPDAIEQTCMTSPFVKQIVVTGQDKNALSALVVPNMEAIQELAKKKKLVGAQNPISCPEIKNEILKELRCKNQERKTYRNHERIADIAFVEEEFSPQNGLMTMTAKIKKNEVCEKYKDTIESMYN